MTEMVICGKCHQQFERECEDAERQHTIDILIEEEEPVCNDCEHQFLAWTGSMPLC